MTSTSQAARRSDAELFGDARIALDRRLTIPEAVHVHIDHGFATLTGTVRTPSERTEAEYAVRAVNGVWQVVNDIAVDRIPSPEGFEPPSDRD